MSPGCRGRPDVPSAERLVGDDAAVAELERRVSVTRSSSERSWVTRSTVPPKASSAASSCSMAGRSRWLVGSSSTSTLTPSAISSASDARVRSPGDSVPPGAATWSATRPNLASSVRASAASSPVASWNARSSDAARRADRGPARPRRRRRSARGATVPAVGSTVPSRASSSVDLPEPLAPTSAIRSPAPIDEVDRSEREVPLGAALDDDAVEPGDDVAAAAGGAAPSGAAATARAACRRPRAARSPARCGPPGRRAARSG